jgi:hypothetical protein
MMKKIGIFLLILLMTCAGCSQLPVDQETTLPSTVTTTEPQQTAPPTTLPPETTAPIETTAPTEPTVNYNISRLEGVPRDTTPWPEDDPSVIYFDENYLSNYTRMFTPFYDRFAWQPENYYNTALCCMFDSPENVPLGYIFYNGFITNYHITEEEKAYMDVGGYDIFRCDPEQMNEVLKYFFGITLDEINWDVQNINYWEKTGCYYLAHTDLLAMEYFKFTRGYVTEDGIVRLYYREGYTETDFYPIEYVITMRSREKEHEYGYTILSNLPVG